MIPTRAKLIFPTRVIRVSDLGRQGVQGPPAEDTTWELLPGKPSTFPPGGAAGGVLSGTYPNPQFAEPMVTEAIYLEEMSLKADLVDGKVPAGQLPSYVDDVLEYPLPENFPATGETGKIYVATDTGKAYRWTGSVYVEIVPSPGSTDAVPEGVANLYFTSGRAAAAAPVQSVAGMTGNVTLGIGNITGLSAALLDPTPNSIQFDTTPTGTPAVGRLVWDATDSTLSLPLNESVTLQIGQETLALCINKTASTIPNGTVVKLTGAQGQRMKAEPASNADESAHQTIGVATQEIPVDGTGFVCLTGLVRGLNTSSFSEGAQLYLGTGGGLTSVAPSAPAHTVRIGTVVNSANGSAGSIFVHVETGSDLADIHDVSTVGAATGDILAYNSGTGLWTPAQRAAANLVGAPCEIGVYASDLTTAITAGTNKVSIRAPFAITVTSVRAALATAQTSGNLFTVDINAAGSSILGTKLTIDNGEKTSTTAATPATITTASIADDAEITVDVDQIGDGTAKGLLIWIKGVRA